MVPRAKQPTVPKAPAGKGVSLTTNHFRVVLTKAIYMYGVTFTPDLGDSSQRRKIVDKLKLDDPIVLVGNNLYTPHEIREDQMLKDVPGSQIGMSTDVNVAINLVRRFEPGMEVPVSVVGSVIVRAFRKAKYVIIRRNYFDFNHKIPVRNFTLIPGYTATIVPSDRGHSLVLDRAFRLARSETVLDEMKKSRDLRRFLDSIKGASVVTMYNNRFYTVEGVDTTQNPSSTFKLGDGKVISFAKYAMDRYKQRVTVADQPLLIARSKQGTVYLVPELCHMTGLTEESRRDFTLQKELAKHMHPLPAQRLQSTLEGSEKIKEESPAAYGLQYTGPIETIGILLPPPCRLDAMKAMREISAPSAKTGILPIGKCLVLTLHDRRVDRALSVLSGYLKIMDRTATVVKAPWDPTRTTSEALESLIRANSPNFVLAVMYRKDKRLYSMFKKVCTHKVGVPSQVVQCTNFENEKRAATVVCNVARAIGIKTGRCPRTVAIPPYAAKTMVVGLDVCHTTEIGKSVVGMTASYDSTFGRYLSAYSVQQRNTEIVTNLQPFVLQALEQYKKANGAYPQNLIFLRDGVGDGQLQYVLDREVPAVCDALKEVTPDTKLMFVVVKKRINTRFYEHSQAVVVNPKTGTLVNDPAVTHPGWYDFYLVSHQTTIGTISPTHYNIIFDEVAWPARDVYDFVYKLCFLYDNWDGPISVPAPCQYAHRIAFQYGQGILAPNQPVNNQFRGNLDICLPQL